MNFAGSYDRDEVWDLADLMLFSVSPRGDLWALIEEMRNGHTNLIYPQLDTGEFFQLQDRLKYLKDGNSIYFTPFHDPYARRIMLFGFYMSAALGAFTLGHLSTLYRALSGSMSDRKNPEVVALMEGLTTLRMNLHPLTIYLDCTPNADTLATIKSIFAPTDYVFMFSDLDPNLFE